MKNKCFLNKCCVKALKNNSNGVIIKKNEVKIMIIVVINSIKW